MSGGAYDYSYQKVDEMAERLERSECPKRRAFAEHLKLVSVAMHDIEWVDSCDYVPGDEHSAIANALGKDGPAIVLDEAVKMAQNVAAILNDAIKEATNGNR